MLLSLVIGSLLVPLIGPFWSGVVISIAVVGSAFYYYYVCGGIPKIYCANSKIAAQLRSVLSIRRRFLPTLWGISAHIQTALFVLRHQGNAVHLKKELITQSDGGTTPLFWFNTDRKHDDADPILLILTGVVGTAKDKYCVRMAKQLRENSRMRMVVKGLRGFGTPYTSPMPETNGPRTIEDLEHCINVIHAKFPDAPILGQGWSQGGVVLTTYLAQKGDDTPLRGLILNAPLFKAGEASNLSMRVFMKYGWFNMRNMLQCIGADNMKILGDHLHIPDLYDRLSSWKDPENWYSNVIIRFTGHDTSEQMLEDVYQAAVKNAANVKRPILMLYSEDDPLLSKETLESYLTELPSVNSYFFAVTTPTGGHCGWFEGLLPKSWVDPLVTEFAAAVLEGKFSFLKEE